MRRIVFLAAVGMLAAGCSTFNFDADTEMRAGRHMALADSLERASTLDEATLEYKIVAEHYPSSTAYQTAVRKTGLLYANPKNPMHDDSLALHWVRAYLQLPGELPDREGAETEITLLERIASLQQALTQRQAAADSLLALTKNQETMISGHMQQLQALQSEVRQVRQELNKLKQVDVEINKSRRK